MKLGSVGCLVLLATLFAAIPSHAISCRQWDRMGPDQKAASIDRMIGSAVGGSGGRQYQVDRGAVERCMDGYAICPTAAGNFWPSRWPRCRRAPGSSW